MPSRKFSTFGANLIERAMARDNVPLLQCPQRAPGTFCNKAQAPPVSSKPAKEEWLRRLRTADVARERDLGIGFLIAFATIDGDRAPLLRWVFRGARNLPST
jgi:hypothetical protein